MPPALIAAVEAWAETNKTSRSDAFRRLVELGLTVKVKSRPTGRLSPALVADVAVEAIDSLGTKVKAPARLAGRPGRRLRAQELATKAIEKRPLKNKPSADGGQPRGLRSFARLALISRRRRGSEHGGQRR
jgi:hypothetical protein